MQKQQRVRLSGFILVWLRCPQCGLDGPVHSALELPEGLFGLSFDVQEDGAALGVGEGSHGDGGGTGEGGRRPALQEQRRVRLSGFILVRFVRHSAGRTVLSTRGGRGAAAGLPAFGLCRRTALHNASSCVSRSSACILSSEHSWLLFRFLEKRRPETVMALVKARADVHCKDNNGYGSRASSLCGRVAHSAGWTVLSTRRWSCRRAGYALLVAGRASCVGVG